MCHPYILIKPLHLYYIEAAYKQQTEIKSTSQFANKFLSNFLFRSFFFLDKKPVGVGLPYEMLVE